MVVVMEMVMMAVAKMTVGMVGTIAVVATVLSWVHTQHGQHSCIVSSHNYTIRKRRG